jgi:hypothetical protein
MKMKFNFMSPRGYGSRASLSSSNEIDIQFHYFHQTHQIRHSAATPALCARTGIASAAARDDGRS